MQLHDVKEEADVAKPKFPGAQRYLLGSSASGLDTLAGCSGLHNLVLSEAWLQPVLRMSALRPVTLSHRHHKPLSADSQSVRSVTTGVRYLT